MELNSVYPGEERVFFFFFGELKTCIVDLLLHNDWSQRCFPERRWTEAHLRASTCAYLSSPAGDSCSASVQTVSPETAGIWGNQARCFNWRSCVSCNNNVMQFWAIALAQVNRIKLSTTTNVHYHGRMMKPLLTGDFFIYLFIYFSSNFLKVVQWILFFYSWKVLWERSGQVRELNIH